MHDYEIVIKPNPKWQLLDFKKIWQYKDLLYIFTWRDIKVRYKQTLLGISWALIQPITSMIIFTIIFGNLAKIPSNNLPYPIFVLSGIVIWTYFSSGVIKASNSLVDNEGLLKKIYIPKEVLPLSAVLTSFIDYLISLFLLLFTIIYFGYSLSLFLLISITLSTFITTITIIGTGMIFSSANIKYRDVKYILPFFIQLLLFISPIVYPSSLVNPNYKYLYALNPITGSVELLRSSINNSSLPDTILLSIISSFVILFLGLSLFNKTQRSFNDML